MQTPGSSLSALKSALARYEPAVRAAEAGLVPLGSAGLDEALGGGIGRACLHEVFASMGAGDAAAAAGFGLGLALRAAEHRPLVWVRQDFVEVETGGLHGAGLAAFGLDPDRLVVVQVAGIPDALRAAAEAARCPAVGAALVELWGEAKALDLTASRRLALAAEKSGVTLVVIRLGAAPAPSAAMSRWSVTAAASAHLEANAPGKPAFSVSLLRHRAGIPGQTWHVEWDCDRVSFNDPSPLPRAVASLPAGRAVAAEPAWRRAG